MTDVHELVHELTQKATTYAVLRSSPDTEQLLRRAADALENLNRQNRELLIAGETGRRANRRRDSQRAEKLKQTVSTADELRNLPIRAVIIDRHGNAIQANEATTQHPDNELELVLSKRGPFTVVWIPEPEIDAL